MPSSQMLFHETCLTSLVPSQVVLVHKIVASAMFSFVSMVSIRCMLNDTKTVTVLDVHDAIAAITHTSKRAMKGGALGAPYTGLAANAYASSNGDGSNVTHASTINFSTGTARPAHEMRTTGGGCAVRSHIETEVCLILKDQGMRKKSDALNAMVVFLKARVEEFVEQLRAKQHVAKTADVRRAAKHAFKGLRII